MLPDLHTDFSRGRSGGLVFPSFSEFSTVYCDPHNQRLWHRQKAEINVFLELSCFFDDPADIGNLISGSSAFSKTSLNIWKFTVHVLLKGDLENFEHYFTTVWDECNCVVVSAFWGIAFLWDWNENWLFPVLWPLMNCLNLLEFQGTKLAFKSHLCFHTLTCNDTKRKLNNLTYNSIKYKIKYLRIHIYYI